MVFISPCFPLRGTAGQTDADVERDLAQGGSPAGRGLSERLRPNQRGSPGTERQPQHPSDRGCLHGEREGQQVSGLDQKKNDLAISKKSPVLF